MSDGYSIYSINGGRLVYGGPFALSCDHGCFHRNGSHGLLPVGWCNGGADDLPESQAAHESTEGLSEVAAVSRCMEQIRTCDAVHVYLDTISCYGTLVELGYADAFAKPIYIYYKEYAHNWKKHLWFAMNLGHIVHCGPGEETSIHPDLLAPAKSYKERYHEYMESDQWKHLREQKLFEAGGRCQLCNEARPPLNVHHRTYDRVFNEILPDLVVLCRKCHKKFHDLQLDAV